MDPQLSTIIITIITGVFSIITLIIQRKQDNVIKKIDEQTAIIEKEKSIKEKRNEKLEEQSAILNEMMILILETNIYILNNTISEDEMLPVDEAMVKSEKLKDRYNKLEEDIRSLTKEYELVLELERNIISS